MLLELSVKNFLSFKDKVTFSMEKGSGSENPNNSFVVGENEVLKVASIYGANASGKTNFLKAFTSIILMVRRSNYIPVNGKWNFIKPFLFDEKTKKEPSEFEIIFVANNIKYKYAFSADSSRIYSESLDAFYSQKPTSIFKRKNINEYEFNNDKTKLEAIVLRNTDNKLFLSTATTWNYDKTKDAFLWFNSAIDTFDNFGLISGDDLNKYENNEEIKEFSLKLLNKADILINDIHVEFEEKEANVYSNDLLGNNILRDNPPKIKKVNIEFEHEVINDNKKTNYLLNISEESSGTKVLFAFAPFLMKAFNEGKTLIVDELERSLHPSLIEFVIKLFNNPNVNKANGQLIFITHATNLLNLDLLRRDQIWFTEKNPDNGVSDLYPLDSFSVRKDENIQKGYINGRYGAIPFIKDVDLWQENN